MQRVQKVAEKWGDGRRTKSLHWKEQASNGASGKVPNEPSPCSKWFGHARLGGGLLMLLSRLCALSLGPKSTSYLCLLREQSSCPRIDNLSLRLAFPLGLRRCRGDEKEFTGQVVAKRGFVCKELESIRASKVQRGVFMSRQHRTTLRGKEKDPVAASSFVHLNQVESCE